MEIINNSRFTEITLELDKIKNYIAEFTVSEPGRKNVEKIHPLDDINEIKKYLKLSMEFKELVQVESNFPIYGLEDIVSIIEKNNCFQMVSNPENAPYVEKFIKDDLQEDLTPTSLEVLAIIAYKGPITRVEIEEIRGINSSYTLRNLLIRGLIERKPHPEDARTYLYEISFDFLRKLGLSSVDQLPEYKKFKEIE